MTHRLDEIKAKTKSMEALATMSNIEGAILVLEQSGNVNLAYRAAQDLDNMEYEIKTQATELLKLREENAQLKIINEKREEITLFECADCNLISTTACVCAECEKPLKAVVYVSL